MYVPPSNSSILLKELRRLLKSSGVTVTPTAAEAEMQFELMSERTQKRILSLSGGGKVAEWELVYQATYRIRDARNELWGQPLLIEQRRDYSYDDTQLLAKDSEEQRLNTEMRTESAREIMRRLSTLARTAPKSSD
jgi:LPS-assembly lipoprotein